MKTTLILPDPLFRRLKRRALETGETLSSTVGNLLRKGLSGSPAPETLVPLPTFDAGKILVDVADRDALYRAMERS